MGCGTNCKAVISWAECNKKQCMVFRVTKHAHTFYMCASAHVIVHCMTRGDLGNSEAKDNCVFVCVCVYVRLYVRVSTCAYVRNNS